MASPESTNSGLGEGLSYEDRLPVIWRPGAEPDNAQILRLGTATQRALHAIEAIEHHPQDPRDDEHPMAAEVQRLESKVDLVMELAGRLLLRDLDLPPPSPVVIHTGGIEWHAGGGAPAPGTFGEVEVYLHPQMPLALHLPARALESAGDRSAGWVRLAFVGSAPSLEESLEKLVFRHHRREVAARHRAES